VSNIKKGRVPLSQKNDISSDLQGEDMELNLLTVDPALAKEIKDKGLVYRFINAPQLQQNYGYHRSGWTPYKREATEKKGSLDFQFGTDPEGYVRRGDLVLAVKTVRANEQRKAKIAASTARYDQFNKQAANQLKDFSKENGLDMRVEEGYEDPSADNE